MPEASPVIPQRDGDTVPLSQRDPQWWDARYLSGDIPWDTGVTPPEVVALVGSGKVESGWALDLGCGSGITSRFLAANGFRVIGLDLSLFALRRGMRQAVALGLPCSFVRASVADLAFLRITATLAVDVGCFHSLPAPARQTYVRSLAEHLAPGGYYLLYTFVSSSPSEADGSTAGPVLSLGDVAAFAPCFALRSAAHGDDRGRGSAWFLMQRV
jgi:SAM-dependent methyltransferase